MVYLMHLHVLVVFAYACFVIVLFYALACNCFQCRSVIAKLCTTWHAVEFSLVSACGLCVLLFIDLSLSAEKLLRLDWNQVITHTVTLK